MFESTRLFYKKMDKTDYDLFYEIYSNQKVMQFTYMDRLEKLEEARNMFEETLQNQNEYGKCMEYIAILKKTNIPVGIVDYDVILSHEKGGIAEIGYFIKPEYWGQGFGTEMGTALIHYLFQNTRIHKIIASCNENNKNSERIMYKLGMKKEGIFKKARYKHGQWENEIKYGLLKDEWIDR